MKIEKKDIDLNELFAKQMEFYKQENFLVKEFNVYDNKRDKYGKLLENKYEGTVSVLEMKMNFPFMNYKAQQFADIPRNKLERIITRINSVIIEELGWDETYATNK